MEGGRTDGWRERERGRRKGEEGREGWREKGRGPEEVRQGQKGHLL